MQRWVPKLVYLYILQVFDRVGGGVEGEEREWLTGLQKKMETVSANIKDIETAASQFNGPTVNSYLKVNLR